MTRFNAGQVQRRFITILFPPDASFDAANAQSVNQLVD